MTFMRMLDPLRGDGRLARFSRKLTDFRRLRREEGGNVMVMYIAASLLLVAMLWAIIGTGARLVQKETLQSAADATAFTAAVVKAKGMNIIAFCNLLMALLLAIIIILRLLKDALILAGILLTVAAALPPNPFLAGLAAEVDSIAGQFANVESNIEKGILQAMNGISKLERMVSNITPAMAAFESFRVGTNAAYKANFGSGELISVALPLPLGEDLHLPTTDGTWKELCGHAKDQINKILDWALAKVVGPQLASWVSKAFGMIASPFEDAVCGSGGTVTSKPDTPQLVTDCNKCMEGNPSKVQLTAQIKGGGGGPLTTSGMPEWVLCGTPSEGNWNGVDYTNVEFQSCVIDKPADLGGASADMEHPLPLVLSKDWQSHTQVRGFTVLTGGNMAKRRQSVAVARGHHGGAGGAPLPLDAVMTMAQAEFESANGHNDLWHMDWRARLVPFTFGDPSAAGGSGVEGAIQSFLSSPEGTALQKQFLIH